MPDLAVFGRSLGGELFSPDSPGYEAIRRPVNVAYREVRPRLVVAVIEPEQQTVGVR